MYLALDSAIARVSSGDHLPVLMDANALTGKRDYGCADNKVFAAYGRDESNDNGESLLLHATNNTLGLLNSFFATPARGVSYTS